MQQMEPLFAGLLVGAILTSIFAAYGCLMRKRGGVPKSPSSENLADMVQEDPGVVD